MPKILQVNVTVNYGSTGKIVEEIGSLAISLGWDSYIAYGRNTRKSESKLIKIGSNFDVKCHAIQTRLFDNHGLASYKATRHLLNVMDQILPDIVHIHNIHGYYLNYKLLFSYLYSRGIPVIWTLHDCWPFTGHCSHYSFAKCEKWKTHCNKCINKNEYPRSMVYDRSYRNYIDKKKFFSLLEQIILVPVSNWLQKQVAQSFLNKYHSKVIHNGIDVNVFTPINSNIKYDYGFDNKFLILGVASVWSKRKGLDDFKELSNLLKDDEVILLVGLNNEQIKNLPVKIKGISRTENVVELVKLYSAADVFLNPTWEDTFPTTNMEAMSCGTPVITYDTGGSVEVISEDTGFVVEQGDLKMIRSIIDKIKGIGKRKFVDCCRNHILNNFCKDDKFGEYISLYNRILRNDKFV